MDAGLDAMVANLKSDRADCFDQGCRQAAALSRLLQESPLLSSASKESQNLISSVLAAAGQIVEIGAGQRNDAARSHALKSVAAALIDALVHYHRPQSLQLPEDRKRRQHLAKIALNGTAQCDANDWQAALLHSQSASLTIPPPLITLITPLTSLLQRALHLPCIDAITGHHNALLLDLRHHPVGCPGDDQLQWTAHLMVSDGALSHLLSQVLHHHHHHHLHCSLAPLHSSTSSAVTVLRDAIASRSDWTAGIAAVTSSSALLLLARSILRSWLAVSGNIHIWVLHQHLFQEHSKKKKKRSSGGDLYLHTSVYPGRLKNIALDIQSAVASSDASMILQCLHTSLERIHHLLHLASEEEEEQKTIDIEDIEEEELWALMLDATDLTRTSLKLLPWCALRRTWGGVNEEEITTALEEEEEETVSKAAAEWIALLLWPFAAAGQSQKHRATTVKMLMLEDISDESERGVAVKCFTSLEMWHRVWCS